MSDALERLKEYAEAAGAMQRTHNGTPHAANEKPLRLSDLGRVIAVAEAAVAHEQARIAYIASIPADLLGTPEAEGDAALGARSRGAHQALIAAVAALRGGEGDHGAN
jgi:hypothetical protein